MEQLPVPPSVLRRDVRSARGGRYLWRPRRNRPRGNEEAEPTSAIGRERGPKRWTETAATCTYVVIVAALIHQRRKSNQPERG